MRKPFIYLLASFCISAIVITDPLTGQINAKDSLLYYLELAARNNPTVLQRFYEYQASLQKVLQAGSLPDPELTVGVFVKPMELVMGKQTADIKLMQMFPWFGTLKAARDEMSLMAKAKYESFREEKLQIYYDVESTWYDLYKTNHEILTEEKSLKILKTIERLALERYGTASSAGVGLSSSSMSREEQPQNRPVTPMGMQTMTGSSPSSMSSNSSGMNVASMGNTPSGSGLTDLYRIKIEIGNLENEIALLKDRLITITAKFNSILGRSLQSTVLIAYTLEAETPDIPINALTDSIINNNPMLGMLRYEKQSLEAREKMVSRMGYPMVGVGVDYALINRSDMASSTMSGKDMVMPMISASLPVYRTKYKAMKTEADILKESSAQNYSAVSLSLQAECFQAIGLYNDARRRIKLFADQHDLSEKSLDILLKSFSAGEAGLSDVLLALKDTLDYEQKQAEAVSDLCTAAAWLRKLGALR